MTTSRTQQLRNNPTNAELAPWKHLRQRQVGGHKFRRQQPLGDYIVDFVCLEGRLIIEVDGGQHAEQELYDSDRTEWLESQGFRVLRSWNGEVLQQAESVVGVIVDSLDNAELKVADDPILTVTRRGGRDKKAD